jgi:hypothetical protein
VWSGSDYALSIRAVKTIAVGLAATALLCGVLAFATWGDGSPSPFLELSVGAAIIGTLWSLTAVIMHRDGLSKGALGGSAAAFAFWLVAFVWALLSWEI